MEEIKNKGILKSLHPISLDAIRRKISSSLEKTSENKNIIRRIETTINKNASKNRAAKAQEKMTIETPIYLLIIPRMNWHGSVIIGAMMTGIIIAVMMMLTFSLDRY